jgi:hypothetical protein
MADKPSDADVVKTMLEVPRKRSGNGKAKSLITKLTEVQASISGVAKTGFNDFHSYSYAEEAAIVAACRDELAKRGVMIIPSIQTVKQEGTLTTIETSYTFCDGTTGEQFVTTWAGTGSDKGDKGLYKAITGSQKYVLLKTFLIPTGENGVADDPEHPAREVVEETPRTPPPPPTGTPQEGKVYIASYRAISGETNGKPWTRYAIEFSDGRQTSTFKDEMGDVADHAHQNRLPVIATLVPSARNPKYTDLTAIALDASE